MSLADLLRLAPRKLGVAIAIVAIPATDALAWYIPDRYHLSELIFRPTS